VHDDQLAPGVDVAVEHGVGLLDHEVGLERHGDVRAAGGDDVGAEGEVGHEAPVHDVPLDAVDARLLEGDDLVAQPREVGRQHGGGDLDRALAGRGAGDIHDHILG
jgi:hypothetical protein